MKIRIANIDFTVENTPEGLVELFKRIDATLKEFQLYFSHILVDGIEVMDNFDEYLEEHLDGISEIDVLFFTPEQYLTKVKTMVDLFREKSAPAIKEVSEEFYGKPSDETWERFTLLLHGVQNLIEIISSIICDPAFEGKVDEFAAIGAGIDVELNNLKDAADQGDMTQLGDIMNYELLPFIELLQGALGRLVDQHVPEGH